jgi:hypothetical protein
MFVKAIISSGECCYVVGWNSIPVLYDINKRLNSRLFLNEHTKQQNVAKRIVYSSRLTSNRGNDATYGQPTTGFSLAIFQDCMSFWYITT